MHRKFVLDRGRHRLAVWLNWPPSLRRRGFEHPSAWAFTGAFIFGSFTYFRRLYSSAGGR